MDENENKDLELPILEALKQAANAESDERRVIHIARHGRELFSFTIRALNEEIDTKCREDNTKYKFNQRYGIKLPGPVNHNRYRSQLIYEATIPADRARIWDVKEMWQHCGVASGVDLIDQVLLSGEKARVIAAIEKLSGFTYDDDDEDGLESVISD